MMLPVKYLAGALCLMIGLLNALPTQALRSKTVERKFYNDSSDAWLIYGAAQAGEIAFGNCVSRMAKEGCFVKPGGSVIIYYKTKDSGVYANSGFGELVVTDMAKQSRLFEYKVYNHVGWTHWAQLEYLGKQNIAAIKLDYPTKGDLTVQKITW